LLLSTSNQHQQQQHQQQQPAEMQLASAYQLLQPLMMPPRLLPTDGRPSRVARAAINSRSPLYDEEVISHSQSLF